MAKLLRLDDIKLHPDQRLEFFVHFAESPLPGAPALDTLVFASREEFVRQYDEWVESLGEREHVFMVMAAAVIENRTLPVATLDKQKTKKVGLDFEVLVEASKIKT